MTSGQKNLFCVGSPFAFQKYGKCGMELSELLPNVAKIADECTFIRTMNTDPINHDPAVTFFGTGHQQPGRPTMGAWLSYGLGSENKDLPAYVVLHSGGGGQPLQSRYWGSGFLPAQHGAVPFRSAGDAVLYLSNPPGVDTATRRELLDATNELNRLSFNTLGDPDISAQISNYELAFRMQASVPELMDISKEPQSVLDLYGAKPGQGSYANNCLLARRLAERGVRFIQLCHRDWDHHGGLPGGIRGKCKETDQASAALVTDLKARGLLDETLVIWGGEFGRTPVVELPAPGANAGKMNGRDHNHYGFSMWLAGGGVRGGHVHGATDEFGFKSVTDPVHVHDLHATILHLLGFNHETFTYRHAGRDFRLTDVHGTVVRDLLA
jgi:hypothetical protein